MPAYRPYERASCREVSRGTARHTPSIWSVALCLASDHDGRAFSAGCVNDRAPEPATKIVHRPFHVKPEPALLLGTTCTSPRAGLSFHVDPR